MMPDHSNKFTKLNSVFTDDGTNVRRQFVLAGLILTTFERFKKYTIDRVDGFFSQHIEISNGELCYIRGNEFKRLIRETGSGKDGQHSNKAFRAALHWFCDANAIDLGELNEIERLYTIRNEIGHELLLILADDRKLPLTLSDVLFIFSIYVKIVRWWIKEIEMTTEPDITRDQYESIDWHQVETIDTIILREILQKALSNDIEWNNHLNAI
ncbi:hypothetical protein AAC691_20925 [Nguyenibacter vanlangensis]|uniref:Mannitol repressor n=1 Tax=Nguyenibacter vanlangensis TaxID=1216886 RepID=A0ABZ3D560_9PROT